MRKRILIIEDDADLLDNIVSLLNDEGYIGLPAKDGDTGIKTAEELAPDLILCDIMMDGIDGYDVLKHVSKNKITQAIPFIFITGKGGWENIRLGMQLGADDYITKPFDSDELLKSIAARLKKVELYKADSINSLEHPVNEQYLSDDYIFVRENGVPTMLKINEILYINAENQYSIIRMRDTKTHMVRKPLSHWEKILPQKNFFRIHRGTIINLDYLVKIKKHVSQRYLAYLADIKKPFVISKRYASKVRKNLL